MAENGLTDRFTGVSGASVGALNTLLFVQGDYAKAESAWMNMKDGDLTRPNRNLGQFAEKILHGNKGPATILLTLQGWQQKAGLFDTGKLSKIVRENISVASLEDKLAYVPLTVLDLMSEQQPYYVEYAYLDSLGQKPEEATISKVMASAALPVAFTPVTFSGEIYAGRIVSGTFSPCLA